MRLLQSGLLFYVRAINRKTSPTPKEERNRQVIGRIDKKCRESDNVRMTYVNDDSDG